MSLSSTTVGTCQQAPVHRPLTQIIGDGDDVIIAGSVSDDEARTLYPDGWQAPRPYIRIVPQPNGSA